MSSKSRFVHSMMRGARSAAKLRKAHAVGWHKGYLAGVQRSGGPDICPYDGQSGARSTKEYRARLA